LKGENDQDRFRNRARSRAFRDRPTPMHELEDALPSLEEADVNKSTTFSQTLSQSPEFESDSDSDCDSEGEVVEEVDFTQLIDDDPPSDQIDVGVASDGCGPLGSPEKKIRSSSRLLHPTNLLVATFHQRLEYLTLNSVDYPPALTFAK